MRKAVAALVVSTLTSACVSYHRPGAESVSLRGASGGTLTVSL